MASTVLPNGIIIPEKYSRDWYNDLYHNWQELDNLLGASGPGDGTLTIQKNGTTVGTFSANQATDETINIEVPDVNNGTLTIQKNGTTIDTFTANSSTDKTVNISVPTKTSDLNNDSGFITGVTWNDVADKPSFATVATSGSYNDLSDKPTIPTVNNATLTIQKNGTNVQTFTANQSTNATANITVPTKTSDLTNDSGFITSDNTKIPLAGSNQISGSLIPATTDAYDLGGSSYQWNNAYIKSLTINGVACGDILTHNVSEFVDVTSAQTIAGVKTFSDIPIVVNGKSYVSKINANRTDGTQTGFSAYNGFKIVCNNDSQGWDNTVFALHIPEYSPTRATVGFKLYDCIEGSSSYKGFGFSKIDNDYQLFPTASNAINLGTSTNKWKSFNGLNPGALSLQGTSLINIASSITVLDGTVANKFTPQVNGWLLINGTGSANEGYIYAVQGRIGMMSANNTVMLRCTALIPVVAGVEVSVTCKLSALTWANIAPCQGNV